MAKRPSRAKARPGRAASIPTPVSSSANPLAVQLGALTEEQRKAVLEHTHPHYDAHADSYRLLLDAYEGSGGFMDGEYLHRYPNEVEKDFENRKAQARYHNYYRALVNIYVRHVFRATINREAKALPELEQWWTNVDGAGTSINNFMMRGAKLALAAGLAGALVDKEPKAPTGPSKADDTAAVIASWFAAPSIVDWDLRAGELIAVKLLEAKPRESILEPVDEGDDSAQTLIWTEDAWVRMDSEANVISQSGENGAEGVGMVPLAIVRPDPSSEHPFLGHGLGGDGKVFQALLNRCSEEDEVLRSQAFSVLTVDVGKDGDVAAAKTQIGNDIGTTRALVLQGAADYITPDMGAPEQIRTNIEFLIREIYRMAHVTYAKDSADAESADSIRLQHTELNEMLASLATVLQDTEKQMAKFWYAWTHPGDRATVDAAFAEAAITIQYSHEFFIADLMEELDKWAAAVKLDLGLEFEHYAKKRVLEQLAPGLDEPTKKKIHAEIEGMEANRDKAMAEMQAKFGAGVERIAAGGKQPPPPKPGDAPDAEAA
jgi:hypothetical protein